MKTKHADTREPMALMEGERAQLEAVILRAGCRARTTARRQQQILTDDNYTSPS
jgi:hypothetical protein